jgi:predicted nucleic acid-binding protein
VSFGFDRPPVILDASAAIQLVVGPPQALAEACVAWSELGRMILAPSQFWPEVANGLLRGRRLPPDEVVGGIEELSAFGIDVAGITDERLGVAVGLAARHGLTVYDALYLQLAVDVDGSLATYDRDLVRAAGTEGLELEQIGSLD